MADRVEIQIAATDEAIRRCHPLMVELRPHLAEGEFMERVLMQQAAGYRLAYIESVSGPACVAGFRIGESLAWGRFLYVDDLVTLEAERSKGYGRAMLDWLHTYAANHGCQQLHLDTGIQRERAHQFYRREGMAMAGYHFVSVFE